MSSYCIQYVLVVLLRYGTDMYLQQYAAFMFSLHVQKSAIFVDFSLVQTGSVLSEEVIAQRLFKMEDSCKRSRWKLVGVLTPLDLNLPDPGLNRHQNIKFQWQISKPKTERPKLDGLKNKCNICNSCYKVDGKKTLVY